MNRFILNSSACRAFEFIENDIKIGTIPWGFMVENPRFNFCVGKNVGGEEFNLVILANFETVILHMVNIWAYLTKSPRLAVIFILLTPGTLTQRATNYFS